MPFRISEPNPLSLPERLRALPAYTPPLGGWQRVSARMQARRRRYVATGAGLAMAASLLAAVGLITLKPQAEAPARIDVAAAPSPVAQLIDRSQRLEHRLARARPQVAVWDSNRASQAALLQAHLRQVDAQLNYADDRAAPQLWRNRVELMNALVELHEPQAPALQYASYQY